MKRLTEQQEINIYACDKFHELAGMVSSYLKVRAMIDYKAINDPTGTRRSSSLRFKLGVS